MNPVSEDGAKALSDFLIDREGIDKAFIVDASPNEYSEELTDAFERQFREKGSIIGNHTFVNLFEEDEIQPSFENRLDEFVQDGTALVMFPSIASVDKAVALINKIEQKNLEIFLVGDMANLYTTNILDKDVALGMVLAMPWHSDALGSEDFACTAFNYWGGKRIGHATAMSYNALKAVVEAMKRTDSPDRDSILSELTSENFKVEGVSGEFSFSENRVANTKVQLVQVMGPREDLQNNSNTGGSFDFPEGRVSLSGERLDFVPLDENYEPLPQRSCDPS